MFRIFTGGPILFALGDRFSSKFLFYNELLYSLAFFSPKLIHMYLNPKPVNYKSAWTGLGLLSAKVNTTKKVLAYKCPPSGIKFEQYKLAWGWLGQ
jgi:hypothetical protein